VLRRPMARVGRRGLIGTMATTAVVAGTATAVSGRVARRQQGHAQQEADAQAYQEQQAAAQQQAYAQPVAPAPVYEQPAVAVPAGGLTPDAIEQLQQLGALKEQGILTEDEFAEQKARILRS
jgi:Short C-terminal domain